MARSLIALAVLVASGGAARAETRAAYGGVARGVLASSLVELDPLATAPGDAEVAALVFETLFGIDEAGQPRPRLALAAETTAALPLRVRLRIREGGHFHDGAPLTAREVAAALERALRDPAGFILAPIRAVAAAGDAVELELLRPAPDLPLLLAAGAAAISRGGAQRLVGSGPFRVVDFQPDLVKLEAYAACASGRPYLDGLTLRAFGSRNDEVASYQVGALELARHIGGASGAPERFVEGPVTLTGWLAFGAALPIELRQAVGSAIDRNRLRRSAVRERSIAATGAPPALGGAVPAPAFDPARARALLEKIPSAPHRLKLLFDRTRLGDRAIADRILADLSRVELDVVLEAVDPRAYRERFVAGDYDLALGSTAPPVPDGGLAELALLAAIDPAQARSLLARAPARVGMVSFASTRLLPLYHQAARAHHVAELRGVAVDGAGRVSWADAHFRR